MEIVISRDFSKTLGGSYMHEGKFSGEEFLHTLLLPAYKSCLVSGELLVINLDGTFGYTPSFIRIAFGGLSKKYPYNDISSVVSIISEDDITLKNIIYGFMHPSYKESIREFTKEFSKR